MPQYQFDVKSGSHTFPDRDRGRFPNAEAARQYAEQHAHDLATVYSRDVLTCEIEVLNEDGVRVALVPAGKTVSLDPLS
jgi:hypothetical protein